MWQEPWYPCRVDLPLRAESLFQRTLFAPCSTRERRHGHYQQHQRRPCEICQQDSEHHQPVAEIHGMADETVWSALDEAMPLLQRCGRTCAHTIHRAQCPASPQRETQPDEKDDQPKGTRERYYRFGQSQWKRNPQQKSKLDKKGNRRKSEDDLRPGRQGKPPARNQTWHIQVMDTAQPTHNDGKPQGNCAHDNNQVRNGFEVHWMVESTQQFKQEDCQKANKKSGGQQRIFRHLMGFGE